MVRKPTLFLPEKCPITAGGVYALYSINEILLQGILVSDCSALQKRCGKVRYLSRHCSFFPHRHLNLWNRSQ